MDSDGQFQARNSKPAFIITGNSPVSDSDGDSRVSRQAPAAGIMIQSDTRFRVCYINLEISFESHWPKDGFNLQTIFKIHMMSKGLKT